MQPFAGGRLDPTSLSITGIDPFHPLRPALPERDALQRVFREIRHALRAYGCRRAILVGHNAAFDLSFLNAAVARAQVKRNPFHPFSCFDTATLAGAALGQTVLAKAVTVAGLEWDPGSAHNARYDAQRSAELFCLVCNRLRDSHQAAEERARELGWLSVGHTEEFISFYDETHIKIKKQWYDLYRAVDSAGQTIDFLLRATRDVTAADQLSLDVQLRVGGPVGKALECLANLRLFENIDVLELGAHGAQRGHRLRGKPALRKVRRTLHEQHHGARAELGLDPFHDIHLYITSSVCAARQAPPADAIAQPRSWTASVRSPRPCADSRRTSPAHPARRR